jgi:hypothetical protein
MKLIFAVLLLISGLSKAQKDTYENYRMMDTTSYRYTGALYLYDLSLKESDRTGKVILEWKNQRNITYHMIEMRDPVTEELIYRQKHYTNIAEFPSGGDFTLYPLFKKQKGEAISINLEEAKGRNYQPISPTSYYRQLEREKKRDQSEQDRVTRENEENKKEKQASNERANRITPKVVVLIIIVFFLAFVIVFGIWLVNYLIRTKDPQQRTRQNNSNP